MKYLTFIIIKLLLSSNFVLAGTIPTKSKILKEASYCIKDSQAQLCKDLISEIEKLQLLVFDQNRFKCQSSLLGMQSAIIETYLSRDFSNERISFMIPYVIKNC